MSKSLLNTLQEHIEGEIHFDPIHKRVYSVDASIYEIEPIGIVVPKHKEDLVKTVQIAREFNTPLIARGAATGIAGGCIGKGLILDLSKYLNQICEINYNEEYAICEPGVVQDQLNEALSKQGYRLGPDTSTGNRATLGGMLANNSAGAHSLRYGTMCDHIEDVELLLSSGKILNLHNLDPQDPIYRELVRIRDHYHPDIIKGFPVLPRRASGYDLNTLLEKPWNPSKLIAGSEGTLGIATKLKLKISKKLLHTGLCVIHIHDLVQGMNSLTAMLAYNPISIELIDRRIITMGKQSPSVRNKLSWLKGDPEAVLVVEFEGKTHEEVSKKLSSFESDMIKQNVGYACVTILDPIAMDNIWDVRKAGLGLLLSKRSYNRAIAFIEDMSVPPAHLAEFLHRFLEYLKSKGKEAGIYGHAGAGCLHIRPYIDLRSAKDLQTMEQIMRDVSDMILHFGGAMSGEHGDGLVRSWLNKKMFGERLYQAFCEVKHAFDPLNLMNPGKIVDGSPVSENLRLSPETKIAKIDTFLDFTREGGFELAADMCNGNGSCRKKEKLMCPSFQATGDEYDTTRARAQALRAIANGHLPIQDLASQEVYDILDLCLECKGCKTECPSEVDMAKMKAEVLHHYHKKYGMSLRSKIFAHIGLIQRLCSPLAFLVNRLSQSMLGKFLFNLVGIAKQREFPSLARDRFSTWFKRNTKFQNEKKWVVLFNDTFTEFNCPEIGQAAVKVLEALGYSVILPPWNCCGRPALSKGSLKQAQAMAEKVVSILMPYVHEEIPIIGLEPSCLLTIKDDYYGLLGKKWNQADLDKITKFCTTFDEFLEKHLLHGKLPISLQQQPVKIKLHGHCHQKSLVGTSPTIRVLQAIPGALVSEIPSGCCGLAGSFGYEKEHYDISMKIGELKLFPAIRSTDAKTIIVADGFSCRSQIAHGTARKAKHLAEVVAEMLD